MSPDVLIGAGVALIVAILGSTSIGAVIAGRRAAIRKANAEAAEREANAELAQAQARKANAEADEIYDRVTVGQFRELEQIVRGTRGELADVRSAQEAELNRHQAELAAWRAHVGVLEDWINEQKPPPPPDRPTSLDHGHA